MPTEEETIDLMDQINDDIKRYNAQALKMLIFKYPYEACQHLKNIYKSGDHMHDLFTWTPEHEELYKFLCKYDQYSNIVAVINSYSRSDLY